MATGSAGNRDRVEVSGLDDDIGGPSMNFDIGPAHDSGQSDDLPALAAGSIPAVGDEQILDIECALDIVQGRELLSRTRTADDDLVAEQRGVVGVKRLAEFEHDVVRDIHGQADRTHSRLLQATLHPERGLCLRIQAGDLECGELVTASHLVDGVVILNRHREAIVGGRVGGSHLGGSDIGELLPLHLRIFASDAAHRQLVAAVGGDVDVEGDLVEAEQRDRVIAGLTGQAEVGQDDDAGVILAEAELLGRADHAIGLVTVGLASSDLEVTGQDGSGQAGDDEVAGHEVVGTADDAAAGHLGTGLRVLRIILGFVVFGADVDAAPVDGLAVRVLFLDEFEHPSDDEGAGDLGSEEVLFLESDGGELGGEGMGVGVGRQIDVVGQPVQWDAHIKPSFRNGPRSAHRLRPCHAYR